MNEYITKIYDKEDVDLIDDKTWENLRVLEQKKRKILENAKALWRLKSRAL
jgi:hypothetical protein